MPRMYFLLRLKKWNLPKTTIALRCHQVSQGCGLPLWPWIYFEPSCLAGGWKRTIFSLLQVASSTRLVTSHWGQKVPSSGLYLAHINIVHIISTLFFPVLIVSMYMLLAFILSWSSYVPIHRWQFLLCNCVVEYLNSAGNPGYHRKNSYPEWLILPFLHWLYYITVPNVMEVITEFGMPLSRVVVWHQTQSLYIHYVSSMVCFHCHITLPLYGRKKKLR